MDDARKVLNLEARKRYWNSSTEEKSAWKLAFARMDTDGSDSVSRKELLSYLREESLDVDTRNFIRAWNTVDVNKNDRLDFYEAGALLMLVGGSVAWCGKCGQIILDPLLYACANCFKIALNHSVKPDDSDSEPPHAYTCCAACFTKYGPSVHEHPLAQIQNDRGVPELSDWTFSKKVLGTGNDESTVSAASHGAGAGKDSNAEGAAGSNPYTTAVLDQVARTEQALQSGCSIM